jgi:ribonuclease P protein component
VHGKTSCFSFNKKNRLSCRAEFQQVMQSPQHRLNAEGCLLLAHANGLDCARLGLIVAKKQVKLAVNRNGCKRQLREYFRQHQQDIVGLDVVILVRKGFDSLDHEAIVQRLDKLWKRLIQYGSSLG